MADLIRVLPKREVRGLDTDPHLREEWLVTNGLGGYASGTVSGAITRRYHGLLIAALPNPLGRMMMLNGLSERLRLPDRRVVRAEVDRRTKTETQHPTSRHQLVRDVNRVLPVRKDQPLFEHETVDIVTPHRQAGFEAELRNR